MVINLPDIASALLEFNPGTNLFVRQDQKGSVSRII